MGGPLAPVMKVLQKVSSRWSSETIDTDRDAERSVPHDRKHADGRRDGRSKRRHEHANIKRETTCIEDSRTDDPNLTMSLDNQTGRVKVLYYCRFPRPSPTKKVMLLQFEAPRREAREATDPRGMAQHPDSPSTGELYFHTTSWCNVLSIPWPSLVLRRGGIHPVPSSKCS